MRKTMSLLIVLFFAFTASMAQTKSITGVVMDSKGQPVSGASILVKGTKNGTAAGTDGKFSISAKVGDVLVISALNFQNQEITVGSESNITVTLVEENQSLSEVVVTALGIKREKKALGYAVSTVDKKDLELRPEGDLGRVLSGKAPGLNILNSSGLAGSGTNIVIRAVSTITGSAQPLFIVDGVPFNGNTNAQADFTYGNQTSSRFLDIDPNNIESVSVLKGLSATTLYGEAGRNGVILITTKNGAAGKINKKSEVTVSQSYFMSKAVLPEYETEWGGGFDLSTGLTFFSNWGAKIQDPPVLLPHPYQRYPVAFPEYADATYAYKFYNSVPNFFRNGLTSNTSVNLGGSSGNVNYNMNYSYLDDKGVTPGNGMNRSTFGFGGNAKLSNKMTISGTLNYVITNVSAPPTSTSFGSGASNTSIFGDVLYTPVTVDLNGLPYQSPIDGSMVYYRPSNDIQNPWWTVHNSFTKDDVNRVYGTMQAKYDVLKNLSVSYRVGFDNYSEFQLYAQNKGGVDGFPTGVMRTSTGTNTIWDHTGLISYNGKISSDWNLNVDAGINSRENLYQQTGMKSTEQLVYGLLDHSNFITHDSRDEGGYDLDYKTHDQSIGAFIQSVLAFREYLYLNLGGRNSWTSTLEKDNRHLFYPSASVAFIPTSAIESLKGSKNINYLKLRLGYATSARFPDPYNTRATLGISTRAFVDANGNAINTNAISDLLPNPALKAELQKETEIGVEGRFIDNRLSLDLTLYKRIAKDQILRQDLDPSTGYTAKLINAGNVTNKGIEAALGYTVIRNSRWRWQLDGLYALNVSRVSNLPAELNQVVIAGYTTLGNFAINDQPFGVIQGNYIERDPKTGQRIVNTIGDYSVSPEIKVIGDPNPLYKVTGISTLAYKAISFRMQWEFTKGGDMYSSTSTNLVGRGVTKDTQFDRALPFLLPGVNEDGTPNDIQTSATEAFFDNLVGSTTDLAIYDATLIRLREASISYSLPAKLISKTPFGSVSLSISGTNLWYYAPNFPKYVHFDPEASGFGVSNGRGLEFFSGPSSRRFGASLRVTF